MDWRNVSSTTVALYEARIQDLLGEDIEFIEKPPPVDPQAPYDGEYIENLDLVENNFYLECPAK